MSNTLSDKTNKSIAEIANKIMQEQPTKVRDFADTKPIESDMVQRVMNLNVPNHFVKEDAEQLDELSKKTLSSYVGKAYWDQGKRVSKAGQAYGYIAGTERRKATHGEISNAIGGKKEVRRDKSRDKGVERALSRLAKEEAEQIDELKQSTIKSYIKQRVDQRHDADSKVERSQVYNGANSKKTKTAQARYNKEWGYDSKKYKGIHRASDRLRAFDAGAENNKTPNPTLKRDIKADPSLGKYHAKGKKYGKALSAFKKLHGVAEEVEQIDEVKAVVKAHGDKPATHAVYMTQHPTAAAGWRGPSRTLEVHVHAKDDEHAKKLATAATKNHGTGGWETPFVPSNPLWQPVKALKEDAEQINEGRFGKAIDRSKLSAAARARLEARDKKAGKETPKAEPAPTSAAVGKRAGRAAPKAKESPMAALAQSFGAKKKAAPKAEPKDETPAQKVRRQNIERQKEYYAKGGSRSGMNVGSGGRTSITGHNTSTAGGAVNAVKSQGRIKTGGLHSIAVDEELKGNQTALDVAKPYGKLTAQDFKALRAKHKKGN